MNHITPQTPNRTIAVLAIALCWLATLCAVPASHAYQDEEGVAIAKVKDNETIEGRQERVLSNYSELEQKLLVLREYEKENNPARSRLLQRSYELSQERRTTAELKRVIAMLNSGELRTAEKSQENVLASMKRLLTLLESEDRGKRIQDELKRNQEYLKEVERLLRIQKSLRGQAEGNTDGPRISKSQRQAADRAKNLAEKIKKNEEQAEEPGEGGGEEGEPAHGKKGAKGKGAKGKGKSKGGPPQGDGAEGEAAEGSESDDDANPIRKRVAAAEERMRAAKKKLDEAQRDDSVKEMNKAIRELEAAKKELEEILRQLREEEVERTLAGLETRFRKMMEREIKVRDKTKTLAGIDPELRLADFEIKAGKLSAEQNSIATEASRALLLLREDGTSVAFPQTVAEMKLDMEQVASRLSASRIGETTVGIENDIIETLGYLVDALAQAQKDQDKNKRRRGGGGGGGGAPGESSLVGQIAEIKMLRALQDRIWRRHSRYAKMLDDPDDLVGPTDDPDLLSALRRLSDRQQQLTEITKEIVESMEN